MSIKSKMPFLFKKKEAPKVPFYESYKCMAEPLYAPWLVDPDFLKVDKNYPEHFEGIYREGRYLQYSLVRNALLADSQASLIEFGVLTGKSLDIFASCVDQFANGSRLVIGVDSFEGLDEPDERDLDVRSGRHSFSKGAVRGWTKEAISDLLSFHKCPIQLVQGWIPNCFHEIQEQKFCFAHIDVDLYKATKDCIEYVYPKMVKGGIILFDDYGFPMCGGARKAVDEFLEDKKEILVPVPSGQAFLIKN